MSHPVAIGDEAPNFDLTSTEDCVLMLADEAPRRPVVLYFFADPASARARQDLAELERERRRLAGRRWVVLAIAAAKLDELKRIQRELELRFPLLVDDRAFARSYGVEDGTGPALFLVDRDRRVRWLARPLGSVAEAMEQVEKALAALPSPTARYPRSIVNRWVDRWVN